MTVSTIRTRHAKVRADEDEALKRLLAIAATDTGQARRIADFLLAWWNSGNCGGFDITTAWGLDDALVEDVIKVFALATRCHEYPDTLGYEKEFKRVVQAWRPEPKE
jgi:hypothetical protein